MSRITASITADLLKNKAILIYCLLLALLGWGLFLMESHPEKVILALLQVTLIVLPLITGVFATMYYYNSAEFIQLLLVQPVRRGKIILGLFLGLTIGFMISFFLGIGLPLVLFYPDTSSLFLIVAGALLSVIFTSLALLVAVYQKDKARSMGVVLLLWAFFAFVFEGIQLMFMYQFSDYPIEGIMLWSTFLNPVSIARILVVMHTDAAALLGLSGAIFQDVFGSMKGACMAILAMLLWAGLPFLLVYKKFGRKDF